MKSISVSLLTYALAIIFALLIAIIIKGLAIAIEKVGLDRVDDVLDVASQASHSLKDEEFIAVAIAVASAQRKQSQPASLTPNPFCP